VDAVVDKVVDFGEGVGGHDVYAGDCSGEFFRIAGGEFGGGRVGDGVGAVVFGDGSEEED